ncbi:Aldolase-type TIM barrel family protein [Striga hermonthica]|uniref:Aldolase-type TIM barrel family protein n=1 Tax=Striga hermonthica TaxID=68872 RepID=A0A9N7MLW5_STRHE|nr:Aldolase-type TIM barrel family protein [Striga hermonthica]
MGWRGILGFEYGIVQAPLGPDISGPELVAAVANAGGLGFLRTPDWEAPDYVKELIRKTRTLTDKPFGVAVVLAFPHEENIKAILEERVAILQVYWGECSKDLVLQAHQAGVKVIPQEDKFGSNIPKFSKSEIRM